MARQVLIFVKNGNLVDSFSFLITLKLTLEYCVHDNEHPVAFNLLLSIWFSSPKPYPLSGATRPLFWIPTSPPRPPADIYSKYYLDIPVSSKGQTSALDPVRWGRIGLLSVRNL